MKKWNEWKRKLKKDMKAAVTVFVTLMIVPAMLITGTAVDISRIYTARSIMQDANQLALNSTLAQYNALLKDIYGLFAVLENDEYGFSKDEDLKTLIKTYINTAMGYKLEEKNKAPHFQIITPAEEPEFAIKAVYDLSNTAVFRRQIAEYAKIRGPVVLVEKILAGLEALTKIGEDIKTVKSKVKLDKGLKAVIIRARLLYKSINVADSSLKIEIETKTFAEDCNTLIELNEELIELEDEIKEMEENSSDVEGGQDNQTEDPLEKKRKELKDKTKDFDDLRNKITNFFDDYSEKVEKQLTQIKENLWEKQQSKPKSNSFFGSLEDKIGSVEKDTEALEKEIDALKEKYNRYKENLMQSSDSTKEALGEINEKKSDKDQLELENLYAKLIKQENRPSDKTEAYLKANKEPLEKIDGQLKLIKGLEVEVHNSDQAYFIGVISDNANSLKKKFNECHNKIKKSIGNLKKYQDVNNVNKKYYKFLEDNFGDDDVAKAGDKAEADAKKEVEELNKKLKEKQNSIKINPAGAKRRPDNSDGGESSGQLFDKFDEPDKGEDKILDSDELKNMNFSFSKAGNLFLEDLILYSYDMTMFSSYNTVLDGDDKEETMNGILMDKDINYLMHWEKEYLAMGKDSPEANIGMVMGIIAAVRFVLNYISSFGLKNLNRELDILSTPAGQFKVLVKEILRLITVVGETAIDCYKLMPKHTEDGSLVRRQEQDSGSKKKEFDVKDLSSSGQSEPVSLIKMTKDDGKDDWTFSLMGAIDALASNKNETETKSIKPKAVAELDYDGYLNIIMIFALPKLCERTQNLVEYNINNKLQGYEAKDGMELKVKLEEFKTDFSLDTQVKIRTLFMPNINTNGMGLPEPVKNFTIQRKDCRGY